MDHNWFVGANKDISKMRKEAGAGGNETYKFISYANVDVNVAKEGVQKLS